MIEGQETTPPRPPTPPLWLPEGSVRSLLALLVTGGWIIMTALGVEHSEDLREFVTLVLGMYFGQAISARSRST